jgi:hypothetical protein
MFECEIVVKAGKSYGTPNVDTYGPVEMFIDNKYSAYCTAVKNHVLACPECEPNKVLRRWLQFCDKKDQGHVGSDLLKTVYRMERACLRERERDLGKTTNVHLVNQFVVRWGAGKDIGDRGSLITDDEILQAARRRWKYWGRRKLSYLPCASGYYVWFAEAEARQCLLSGLSHGRGLAYDRMMVDLAVMFDAGMDFPKGLRLSEVASAATVAATVASVMLG